MEKRVGYTIKAVTPEGEQGLREVMRKPLNRLQRKMVEVTLVSEDPLCYEVIAKHKSVRAVWEGYPNAMEVAGTSGFERETGLKAAEHVCVEVISDE